MQQDHRENLNLLFYDFNHSTKKEGNGQLGAIAEEGGDLADDGAVQFQSKVSSTGTNFFSRFGDRLPTRETKSRRGRFNYLPSGSGQRMHSLAENPNNQKLDEQY